MNSNSRIHDLYREGNAEALLDMMTNQQRLRFRKWCIALALKRIKQRNALFRSQFESYKPPGLDAFLTQQDSAVEALQNWITHPSQETTQIVRQMLEEVSDRALLATMHLVTTDIHEVVGTMNRAIPWINDRGGDAARIGNLVNRAQLRAICAILQSQ